MRSDALLAHLRSTRRPAWWLKPALLRIEVAAGALAAALLLPVLTIAALRRARRRADAPQVQSR